MCGASPLRVLVSPPVLVGCSPSDWVTWWDSTALKFIVDFFSASWLETSWLLHKYTYTHVHKQIICSYMKLFLQLPLAWWSYCGICFPVTIFSLNPMSFVVFSGRKSPSTLLTQFNRALCLQVSPFSAQCYPGCNVQWQKMGLLVSGSEVIYITPHTNAFIKI